MLRSDPRIHYKMYKAKKNMVYAALFSFAVLGGLGLSQNAKADTVENTENQPVVQTEVNSATPVTQTNQPASAAPTTEVNTFNVSQNNTPVTQTNQPASTAAPTTEVNTFNVSQNSMPVTNVTQSLVQTTQARATNVHTEITSNEDNTRYDVNNLYVGQSPSYDFNGTFTINSNDLIPGKSIYIDDFHFTSSDNNNTWAAWFLDLPVKYNGQTIGQLQYAMNNDEATGIQLVNLQKVNAIGNINLSFSAKGAFSPNYHSSASRFTTLPKTETFWFGSTPNDKTTIQFTKATTPIPVGYVYGDNSTMANDSNLQIHDMYQTQLLSYSDFQKIVQGKGHADSVKLRTNQSFGLHYAPVKDASALKFSLNQVDNLAPIDPDTMTPMTDNGGTTLAQYDMQGINSTLVEDNLSLEQLRNRNSNNAVLVSRQNDGSYNIWVRYDMMRLNENQLQHWINKDSFYPAASGKTRDSILKASTEFYLNGTLNGYSPWSYISFDVQTADPSISNEMKVTRYDNNLNIVEDNLVAKQNVVSSMAHGQAAVKLHVINATNGAELNQWSKLIDEARNKKNSSQ